MFRMRVLVGLLTLCIVPFLIPGKQANNSNADSGKGQIVAHKTRSREEIAPEGTIDGSKTPWLIPDAVAYRLFFLTVSEAPIPSEGQIRRQRSRLVQANLTEDEYRAVSTSLSEFKLHQAAFELRYSQIADQLGSVDETSLAKERDAIVESTRQELRNRLGPDAMSRLEAPIQREKRNMKIVPNPSMPEN
jgi:hypothetical protein